MKGTYVLFIELDKDKDLSIGKIGTISFKKGWYVYIGSALNGLEQRIRRHKRNDKKKHWHIDYFLDNATIRQVFMREGLKKEECSIASYFSENFSSIPLFGCSDCSCDSHLFYGDMELLYDFSLLLGLNIFSF